MSTEPYRWNYDYTRMVWDTGFAFNGHKSLKAFDRNTIAILDIERIIRERDIGIVEHYVQSIVEFNLDSEEARILDPTFVKLFRLSQLAVEYLNYCKKYLDSTTDTLKKELQKVLEENDELKHDITKYELEGSKLKKKIKDLKSTLHIHQKYQPISTASGIFRCNECRKGFVSGEYLKKHFLKRHPDSSELQNFDIKLDSPRENIQINTTPVHNQYKTETDRLQMEIKELKEKLNNTERFFQNKTESALPATEFVTENHESKVQSEEYYKHVEELHHQFELLKVQIESEMHLLKSQRVEQDKYEQWMQTFFQKLDDRKEREIEKIKILETTQTEPTVFKLVEDIIEKSVQTEEVINENESPRKQPDEPNKIEETITLSEGEINVSSIKMEKLNGSESSGEREIVDVEKIKEEVEKELEEKAKQNIELLGKQISEKMTNTFEVLQERLETFWNKIQEIESDRQKKQQQLIIYKSPPKSESTSSKKDEEPTKIIIETTSAKSKDLRQVQKKIVINQSSDDDSETESSKDEKISDIPNPPSVLRVVQKNHKLARNLMAELKTKIQEQNTPIPKSEELKKPIVVQKPTVQQIYSKTICHETSTEESDSETETESESESHAPVIEKPSKAVSVKTLRPTTQTTEGGRSTTTGASTLKNRSILSLENALRSNPDIFMQLRNDMKDIVVSRLKDLGIDPEWSRIPEKTYKQNSEIVSHHRSLAAKNTKNFMDIRDNILENLNEQIKDIKHHEARNITPEPEQKKSRFKSMLLNMREKAKSIIKYERNFPTEPIYKLTIHKKYSSPNMKRSPDKVKSKEFNKSKSLDNTNIRNKESVTASKMYDTDSDDDTETNDYQTSPTKSKIKSVQSIKAVLRKSKSDSSMEVVEFSDQGSDKQKPTSINNLAHSLDSIVEIKRELANQLKNSKEKDNFYGSGDNINNKDEVIAVSPREKSNKILKDNLLKKTIETEKSKLELSSLEADSDDDLKDEEKFQKSVLKNMASTSAAVKKKVLFDLDLENKTEFDTKEQKSNESKTDKSPVKKTSIKTNNVFKANSWNGSSTSIESSILEPTKTLTVIKGKSDTISTKAVINVSAKQNKAQADISDWDISDIN